MNNDGRLPFYVVPEKDETVYSTVCRCVIRSNRDITAFLQELTGQKRRVPLLSTVPALLSQIAAKVPFGHPWYDDPHRILRERTLLPYYLFGDLPEQRLPIYEAASVATMANSIPVSLGLSQYRCEAVAQHLRYCPQCAKEDMEESGFPYFHLKHQLPGVAVCWKHGEWLAHGCRTCGTYPLLKMPRALPGICRCKDGADPLFVVNNQTLEKQALLWIAQQSAAILDRPWDSPGLYRADIKTLALQKGFGRGRNVVPERLANAVLRRFGEETLSWLKFPAFVDGIPAPWIRRFLNDVDGGRRRPLIISLLLVGVLADSLEAFLQSVEAIRTPVLCLNNEATYPQWHSQAQEILESGECGIPGTAKRLGIRSQELIKVAAARGWRVPLSAQTRKIYGEGKIAAIREGIRAGRDKTEIRKSYGCSDWTMQLIELSEPGLNQEYHDARKEITRERNRQKLLDFMESEPAPTREGLQEKEPGAYEFLIEYDKEWFDATLPKATRVGGSVGRKPKTDWQGLDSEKARELEEIRPQLYDEKSRPVRVTKTYALKKINSLSVHSNSRANLPLVDKALTEIEEDVASFQRRKIRWALNQLIKNNGLISPNTVRLASGFSIKLITVNWGVVEEELQKLKGK